MNVARRVAGRHEAREAAGIAMVVALTVVGAYVEAHPAHHYAGLHLTGAVPAVGYVLPALSAVALLGRRRFPVRTFAVTATFAVGWAALGQIDGATLVPVIVATYGMALRCPRRVAAVAGLAGAFAIWLTEGLVGPFGWLGGPNATMWPELLAAGAVGAYVAARRQWLAAAAQRSEQAERNREGETRRRVDAERMRIARELHDVVAHSMAMITVQASAAGLLLGDDPAGAADAIAEIRRASKNGLRELRAILDVLRVADGDEPAVAVPDLQAMRTLAEAATAAGAPTTLVAPAAFDALPAQVRLAAYRIVQESVTNVVRHAGGAVTSLTVSVEPGQLCVEVVDGGGRAETGFGEGTGAGLSGMRERAMALGGALEAGPCPGGGFRVSARLPVVGHPATADLPPSLPLPSPPKVDGVTAGPPAARR